MTLPDDELEDAPQVDVPTDLVPPLERAPDFVWSPDEVRSVWADEGFAPIELAGATELAPLPQGQPFSFDAQRPAIAARGLSEAENELNGLLEAGARHRRRVPAPRRGAPAAGAAASQHRAHARTG